MKYFHHYMPLNPAPPESEVAKIRTLSQVEVRNKHDIPFWVTILGRPHTYDAVVISGSVDIPEDVRSRMIMKLSNHMLSAIRITHNPEAGPISQGDGFFSLYLESDTLDVKYEFKIIVNVNENHVANIESTKGAFISTLKSPGEELLSLLAEAQVPQIPLHYKILSICRAFEILIPAPKDRDEWIAGYSEEFSKLGLSQKTLKAALLELRTRCAHGVSRGSSTPFTSGAYDATQTLQEWLKFLRKMLVERIGDSLGGKLTVSS